MRIMETIGKLYQDISREYAMLGLLFLKRDKGTISLDELSEGVRNRSNKIEELSKEIRSIYSNAQTKQV